MMIYSRIKTLCKEKKISVNKLEEILEISKGSLCKIDVNKPSAEKMQKIADFFGVTVEFLATGEESKEQENEIVAKNDTEKRLLLLCRRAESASDQDKEMILKNFENTIDMYLQAKGLKAEEQ